LQVRQGNFSFGWRELDCSYTDRVAAVMCHECLAWRMDEHCSLNVAGVFKVYYGFVILLKILIVLGYLGCTFHLLDLCFWSFRPEGLLVRCLTDLKVLCCML
jgi:hypothetical protein